MDSETIPPDLERRRAESISCMSDCWTSDMARLLFSSLQARWSAKIFGKLVSVLIMEKFRS